MTEMFGEAWPPMSVPDLAPDDDDDDDDDDSADAEMIVHYNPFIFKQWSSNFFMNWEL